MASSSAAENPPRHSPTYYPASNPHDAAANGSSPRVPRTHSNPGVVLLFKSLTLRAKLKMCKDIEDQNDERRKGSLLHAVDPQSHPEPGSETASMFTIDDDDIHRLRRSSYAAMFKDHCGMIPLPLFLNSSLLYITVNAASVPTFKANPKLDERKGNSVIDCKKLLAQLNLAELQIDMGQWVEASYNCFRFQCERDTVKSGGAYSAWWDHHFNFFNFRMDKIEYYDAWKSMELELRQEFYARPCAYDADYYARKYDIVKFSYDLKHQMQSTTTTSTPPTSSPPTETTETTDI
ncbi:hypothetical protein GALMADRAFT_58755 [Galerina marginata CBS 339.88]|uniref:Uncharacterized protein n=1 Tax=Galerina marginata (strain CBS 339.88) TaxID=685588 RepID=A0A067TIP2_GALM3|nr:hypothetical protein GALMADRAFT_58755 [Galerina marginata CBS 339.88]